MKSNELDKYIFALKKCAVEHKKEGTPTGCIVVHDLCSDTAKMLEDLQDQLQVSENEDLELGTLKHDLEMLIRMLKVMKYFFETLSGDEKIKKAVENIPEHFDTLIEDLEHFLKIYEDEDNMA